MTTDINNIYDLLQLLDDRPDLAAELRQRILTPELLAMPQLLAELTSEVKDFIAEQRETNRRTDARLARLEEIAARSEERLTRLEEIAAHSEERLTRLEEIAARSEERQARLEEIAARSEERHARLENRVSIMYGDVYELNCVRRFPSLIYNHFRLVNTTIHHGGLYPPNQQFYNRLMTARDQGKISEDDFVQLLAADCLAYSWDSERQQPCYLAAEISVTLDRSDIDRARQRADALARATDAEARAVVISANIADFQGQQARDAGVAVIYYHSQ